MLQEADVFGLRKSTLGFRNQRTRELEDKLQTKSKALINNERSIKLKSPSKINFGLWIKERRPDNYHEIETIFYENNKLFDEIEIEIKEDKHLSVEVLFLQKELNKLIPAENNLAYKAAILFFSKIGFVGSCNIKINKNIPLKAGLGGGSTNAAFVLKGLNKLFNNMINQSELLDLASKIGSDAPFFIIGNTCHATGKGEVLKNVENNLALEIKVLKPDNISISTAWAYELIDSREFLTDRKTEISNLLLAMKNKNQDLFFKNLFNDFEMVVFSYFPELINLRNKLFEEGFMAVGLCGSGSAIYGVRKAKSQL